MNHFFARCTNLMSFLTGRMCALRLPRPFMLPLLKLFAVFYRIDLAAAAQPLSAYPSLADLFTRDLRPGARPIGAGLVSPVDGVLRNFGPILDGKLPQVKGQLYTVADFLQNEQQAERYRHGFFFNLYLSPRDYHHVHAPVAGLVSSSTYIPGALWPVNEWSLRSVKELFLRNERLVTYIDSEFGTVAVVMVGATNVGKISVAYDDWITNSWARIAGRSRRIEQRDYEVPRPMGKGQRLGTFHLGSSVVVLVEPSQVRAAPHLSAPSRVVYGQWLGLKAG